MTHPLVSVVVPIYNVEKFLSQCVDSILGQTYKNLEIILVDDGSPDGSGDMCDKFAKNDERVRVVHKENGGVSSARNKGIDEATGKYIIFIDGDDFISGDAIEVLVYEATEVGDGVLVMSGYRPYHTRGYAGDAPEHNFPENKVLTDWQDDADLTHRLLTDMNSSFNKLYLRQMLEEHKIRFPENLKIAEDLVFVVDAFLHAKGVLYTGRETYYYRTDFDNESSAMARVAEEKAFDFGKALKIIEKLFNESGKYSQSAKAGFKRVVVSHSLYALYVVEKDTVVHKKVFAYIKDDLFKHFKIGKSDAVGDADAKKVEMIKHSEYDAYIIYRLGEAKQYLFSSLDAIGGLTSDLSLREEQSNDLKMYVESLEKEIGYLKSVKGMIRTPLGRVSRKLKRAMSKKNN